MRHSTVRLWALTVLLGFSGFANWSTSNYRTPKRRHSEMSHLPVSGFRLLNLAIPKSLTMGDRIKMLNTSSILKDAAEELR